MLVYTREDRSTGIFPDFWAGVQWFNERYNRWNLDTILAEILSACSDWEPLYFIDDKEISLLRFVKKGEHESVTLYKKNGDWIVSRLIED